MVNIIHQKSENASNVNCRIYNKNGGHGGDETIALAGITAITDSAPSGQPLPGVLAALLIGGATFGVLRLRRKYSKA